MKQYIPSVITGIIVGALCLSFGAMTNSKTALPKNAPQKETTYERIIRTGELKCGYYVFPPAVYRDGKTGELSGLTIDMMNEIGKRSGLKITWAQEITWGTWAMDLQAGRYDVACAPQWPEVPQTRAVTFIDPMFYAGLSPIVRANDERFIADPTLDRLNKEDITILTQVGNATETLVSTHFPKAKIFTIPAESSGGEYYQTLKTKKVDAVITDRNGLFMYTRSNTSESDRYRAIEPHNPIKLQSFNMAIMHGEHELEHMLTMAQRDIMYDGTLDKIMRKWEGEPGLTFLRVALPYATPDSDKDHP